MSKEWFHKYGCWIGTIVFIFFVFFLINYFTPAIADDYTYMDHYQLNSDDKIQTVHDFFQFLKTVYFSWSGRIVGHFFIGIVYFLPPIIFDILNTLAYLLLSFLIYKICNMGNDKNIRLFIVIQVALWLYIPDYGQVMFWTTGSIVYLWMSLFCLLSLYIYRKYALMEGEMLKSVFGTAPLFILGLLSGCAMENISAGMLIIMTFYMLYFIKKKIRLRASIIALYLGSIVGFGVLFFAPGNFVRADTDKSLGIIFKMFIIGYYWIYFGLFLFGICAVVLYAQKKKLCKIDKEINLSALFFWISSLCSVLCLIVAPSIPERAWYISTVYATIAAGIFLGNVQVQKQLKVICKSISLIVICICAVFCIVSLADTMICSYEIFLQTGQREVYIEEQIAEGKQDLVVPIITHKYPFRSKHDALEGLSDITEDSTFWINVALAKHYGVHSITGQ